MSKQASTTPAQDQAQDASQPVGTPPGGGSWTWDATQRIWVPKADAAPAQPNTEAQE